MITDKKLVNRAEKYAAGAKRDQVHPDTAAQLARFEAAFDGGTDHHIQAHAKALMLTVAALEGDAAPEHVAESSAPQPAKRAAAKRSSTRRRRG